MLECSSKISQYKRQLFFLGEFFDLITLLSHVELLSSLDSYQNIAQEIQWCELLRWHSTPSQVLLYVTYNLLILVL